MEDRIGQRCLKKLNLNIPPLSVRRHGGFSNAFEPSSIDVARHQGQALSSSSGNRVPFSWEQAPGKPKAGSDQSLYSIISSNRAATSSSAETQTPRPKPPPGQRWHQDNSIAMIQEPYAAAGVGTACSSRVSGTGSWCSVEDRDCCYCCSNLNSNNSNDAVVETLSLSEAIDVLEKSDRVHELDASKLKMVEAEGNMSPSFIMNRFLPDANALAVESFCWNWNITTTNMRPRPMPMPMPMPPTMSASKATSTCIDNNDDIDDQQQTNMKVCGLQNLFSWRMKHRICGVNKSHVLNVRPP